MDMEIFQRMESEVRGYSRSFPTVFKKAQGSTLIDEDGNTWIDFLAGAGTLNYGHNNPAIKEALIDYLLADGVVHGLDTFTTAKRAFLEALDTLILKPRRMNYKVQFPGPTGTNAVEAAFKLARMVKHRNNIVSFTNGFHGVSLGSLSATANSKFRDGAGVSLGDVTFMPYCDYMGDEMDTLAYLRQMLDDPSSGLDHPAAVIVETVQGEGGVNVASIRWLRELALICRDYDMLLIADDIQVGNGRTGTFFSFEAADFHPDIVLLSKSLGGYGLPLSLLMMKPELDVWKPGQHNGTFRGNNLALVAATAAFNTYWTDSTFARDVRTKGRRMRERLNRIADAHEEGRLTVRGRGMIQGLVCDPPELADQIAHAAYEHGVVIETSGARSQVIKCLPALTIQIDEIDRAMDVLEQCAAQVIAQTKIPS